MRAKLFFIYENFIFNSVSFCYCRGSYGPPYFPDFLPFSMELRTFSIFFDKSGKNKDSYVVLQNHHHTYG